MYWLFDWSIDRLTDWQGMGREARETSMKKWVVTSNQMTLPQKVREEKEEEEEEE